MAGKVSYCSENKFENSKIDCLAKGFDWITPANNYDNFMNSLVTFFEISTLEMWPDIMFAAVDSSSVID